MSTLEFVYRLVGKEDKVAGLNLRTGSDSYYLYGNFVVVVFEYNQRERERMDILINDENSSTFGMIKAKYLGVGLPKDKIERLHNEGINVADITSIHSMPLFNRTNTFHFAEKRVLNKHIIEFDPLPNGEDLGWMYGFHKRLVERSIGLSPEDRYFYLAGKLYLEPDEISEQESDEIYDDQGQINKVVEYEFLKIKKMCDDMTDDESLRLIEHNRIKLEKMIQLIDQKLLEVGSSWKKLSEKNSNQATLILEKVLRFKEKRMSVKGEFPIYLDIDGFLHVYFRHVEEFQVNAQFENKDNFQ
jgi:hypothetical protein